MSKRMVRVACAKANWDGGENPFNLQEPPAFILKAIREYDSHLVLLPGISQAVYRLCLRSPSAHKLKIVAQDGEVKRAARIGCLPLVSVVKNPDWWGVLQWIKDHDTWAHGGGAKMADKIEDNERAAADRLDATIADEATQRAISGWHGWQFRTGQATFVRGVAVDNQPVVGQPSGRNAGPGSGDFAHGSLPRESSTRQAEDAGGHAQAEDPAPVQGAVLVPGAAQGQS